MPIRERDRWRLQYFERVACPAEVLIPTDDIDAYGWNPRHRWVYNKLLVAESQGLDCAPHGVAPPRYPVFSKPIFNLKGMGVGSRILVDAADYERHERPGHMWTTLLKGEHVSSDAAVVDGTVHWMRHSVGLPLPGGMFDYWIIESGARPTLESFCSRWIGAHLRGYTGMVNIESIGGAIIEVHLRFADQWPDLYGAGWIDAMVRLYSRGIWDYDDADRRTGYSVVLFGSHAGEYAHPAPALVERMLAVPGISSLQFTFDEHRPTADHVMPPGGFRLSILNAWDLLAAKALRQELAEAFGLAPARAVHATAQGRHG